MGDIVADSFDLLHQALDFAQHAVDDVGQPVESRPFARGSAIARTDRR